MNKEAVRNSFLLLYNIFDVNISGQNNFDILNSGESVIIPFYPHIGHLDGPLARLVVPNKYRKLLQFPAGADYWYKNDSLSFARKLIVSNILPAFPLNRSGAGKNNVLGSLDVAEKYLLSGYSLVLSPEGTRSSLPFEKRVLLPGVAELVLRTEKPVIPLLFEGLEEVMPRGTIIPRFLKNGARREISAKVGKPVYFERTPDLPKSRQRKEILNQLKSTYEEMKNN